MKQHLFTVGRQENMLSKLGSQSLLKGSVPFCTTRWQCVHRHIFSPDKCFGTPPPPFLFLSISHSIFQEMIQH